MRKLSAADARALKAFLASDARPEGTLSFHELQGFLFTIAGSPRTVPPSDWIPFISNDEPMIYANMTEAKKTMERLMALYNEINAGVLARSYDLPSGCDFRKAILDNFDRDTPISQWSRGFLAGHNWLGDVWQECLPESIVPGFGSCLMTLSFFSSRQLAEGFFSDLDPPEDDTPSFEEFAEMVGAVFPCALADYADMGRGLFETGLGIEEKDCREPASRSKTGRNEPCPCGSGKKYKKCCGPTEH